MIIMKPPLFPNMHLITLGAGRGPVIEVSLTAVEVDVKFLLPGPVSTRDTMKSPLTLDAVLK